MIVWQEEDVWCASVPSVKGCHNRTTGTHWIYKNPELKITVSIPIHGNKDLPIGTLKSIMKDTDLTENDLL